MNPFLEIPIKQSTTKIVSSGLLKPDKLVTEEKPSILRARPGEMESYEPEGEGVLFIMKSGREHHSPWSFDQMDQALSSYNDTINNPKNKGKFGNVVINDAPKVDKVEVPNKEPKLQKV